MFEMVFEKVLPNAFILFIDGQHSNKMFASGSINCSWQKRDVSIVVNFQLCKNPFRHDSSNTFVFQKTGNVFFVRVWISINRQCGDSSRSLCGHSLFKETFIEAVWWHWTRTYFVLFEIEFAPNVHFCVN